MTSGPSETDPSPPPPVTPSPPPPPHAEPEPEPQLPIEPHLEVYPSVQRVVRVNLPMSPLQLKQIEVPIDALLPERSEPSPDLEPKLSPPELEVPPEPVEELLPQKIEEPDTQSLLPAVGDLEPPLEILNLLLNPDAIEADLSYELATDPISSLFAFELGVEKAKPEVEALLPSTPPRVILPPSAKPPPRIRKGKKDRTAEYAARNLRRGAEKAARRAKAEAASGPAPTSANTSSDSSTTPRPPKPQSEYPAVVDSADGLDKRSTFALFESGWILPADQKRNGRKAPPPIPVTVSASIASTSSLSASHKKRERRGGSTLKDRTSSLSRSTAPSEYQIPDEGMDVDPPPAPPPPPPASASALHPAAYGTRRQSRLEAELTGAERGGGGSGGAGGGGGGGTTERHEEEFPRLVREHGRAIIEEIETPASRREKARKRKERRISELTGASEPEPEPQVAAAAAPEEEAPAIPNANLSNADVVVSVVTGDVEMADEESELSDVPDEAMEEEVAPPPPPPPVETLPVQTQTEIETAPLLIPLPVIPRPPYQPLPRQYSVPEFNRLQKRAVGTPEAAAMLARGRMKEGDAVPDTLVWVKGRE